MQKQLEIRLKRLFYNERELVKDINLDVYEGDRILLVGETGTGKSSLLNSLNMMNHSYEGEILFEGKRLQDYAPNILRSRIVMVMQEPYLGEGSVKDVLMEALKYHSVKKKDLPEKWDKIEELFEAFELSVGFLDKKAEQLSGGEKQRIALTRALLIEPEILLLDEVSSALDQRTSGIISDCIFQRFPKTVIAISHDPLWQGRWERRWEISGGKLKDTKEL